MSGIGCTDSNKFYIVWTPLHKGGGWDFSKMARMGGWKIFTRNGGKPGIGGGGVGFMKYEDSPILLTPLLFQILSNHLSPTPCHLQPPPQLFFLLSCFFGWMGDHASFDVLFYYNMNLHITSLGTLVPEVSWCGVLCNKA